MNNIWLKIYETFTSWVFAPIGGLFLLVGLGNMWAVFFDMPMQFNANIKAAWTAIAIMFFTHLSVWFAGYYHKAVQYHALNIRFDREEGNGNQQDGEKTRSGGERRHEQSRENCRTCR